MKRILYVFAGLVCFSLLSVVAVKAQPKTAPNSEDTDRWANLALRQIGHELLLCMGDANGQLPPVIERGEGHYFLATNRHLDYNSLLEIGTEVMSQSEWTGHYSLILEDCKTSRIILGFHSSFTQNTGEIACSDREQEEACYNLSLVLMADPPNAARTTLLVAGLSLTGVFTAALFFLLPVMKKEKASSKAGDEKLTPTHANKQLSAQTIFTPGLQSLTIAGQQKELTYREAKLLDYLTDHPNEVLQRESIHAAVWGTEGIMVSRSLDVFISRLRKKLSGDPSLEIATIHGIGYRLLLQRSA